jgi:hypothetical protein
LQRNKYRPELLNNSISRYPVILTRRLFLLLQTRRREIRSISSRVLDAKADGQFQHSTNRRYRSANADTDGDCAWKKVNAAESQKLAGQVWLRGQDRLLSLPSEARLRKAGARGLDPRVQKRVPAFRLRAVRFGGLKSAKLAKRA